jgi:polyhydroxyalkanoate synthesis regulator phasin
LEKLILFCGGKAGGVELKKAKWMFFILAIIFVFTGNIAYAAGNLTDIEQKWLAFQRALKEQQVKDGEISSEQAKSYLSKLESELSSNDDSVYEHWKEMKADKCHKMQGRVAALYARMTNRNQEEIEKLCKNAKISVWELAEKEGKLNQLKEALLNEAKDKFSRLVKEGKMTQQEMDKKLEQIKKRLSEGMMRRD